MNKTLAAFLPALTSSQPAIAETREDAAPPQPPVVVKKGTIDFDLCETSPFVFKGKLYRLEWHRKASRLPLCRGLGAFTGSLPYSDREGFFTSEGFLTKKSHEMT